MANIMFITLHFLRMLAIVEGFINLDGESHGYDTTYTPVPIVKTTPDKRMETTTETLLITSTKEPVIPTTNKRITTTIHPSVIEMAEDLCLCEKKKKRKFLMKKVYEKMESEDFKKFLSKYAAKRLIRVLYSEAFLLKYGNKTVKQLLYSEEFLLKYAAKPLVRVSCRRRHFLHPLILKLFDTNGDRLIDKPESRKFENALNDFIENVQRKKRNDRTGNIRRKCKKEKNGHRVGL